MRLLTENEKKLVVKFLKWAAGFLGCCGIYIELIAIIRNIHFGYPIEWKWLLILFPMWLFLVYIGRKVLPFRSIYFWLIFLVVGVIGLIKIFFYQNPNLGSIFTAAFIFATAVFLFKKTSEKDTKKK